LHEQLVAARMPERVVDLLEAIEVHDHHGDPDVLTAGNGEGLPDPVVEERSVRQVGERVVERLMLVDVGLLAQRVGGAGDDPEEDGVEHGEAEEDEQRHVARIPADAGFGFDRRVGKRELDRALGVTAPAEPQRHVDVEIPARLGRRDLAVQYRAVLVRKRKDAPSDLCARLRVDDAQRSIPDRDRLGPRLTERVS
jgi:hypothetical protein